MGTGEIPLNDKRIDKVFSEDENRLIYVYDFLHLWTFFIELVETAEKDALKGYPSLIFLMEKSLKPLQKKISQQRTTWGWSSR